MTRVLISALIFVFAFGIVNVIIKPHDTYAQSTYSKEDIEKIIHDYLMQNPDVILDSVAAGQEKQRAEQTASVLEEYSDYIYNNTQATEAGNPKGDVVIVEFFDYNCGYCKRMVPSINQLVKNDENLRIVFMEFPILGESSKLASRYALAARMQERYFDFHLALMDHKGQINKSTLENIAKSLGIDWDLLQKDADSQIVAGLIDQNYTIAQGLGISGTPAFLVGDELVGGAISYETLKDLIAKQRDKS